MIDTYEQFTIGELIDRLEQMPRDETVPGLRAEADSYRGYYEHVAIAPGTGVQAGTLLDLLRKKIGTMMHGYKGGDYMFDTGCRVFVANYGDTGPMLCGSGSGFAVVW